MRLFRFLIRRKHRLDPQFLCGHGLRSTDRCNQRKIIQHRLGFAEADWDHWQDRRSADCPAIFVSWFRLVLSRSVAARTRTGFHVRISKQRCEYFPGLVVDYPSRGFGTYSVNQARRYFVPTLNKWAHPVRVEHQMQHIAWTFAL